MTHPRSRLCLSVAHDDGLEKAESWKHHLQAAMEDALPRHVCGLQKLEVELPMVPSLCHLGRKRQISQCGIACVERALLLLPRRPPLLLSTETLSRIGRTRIHSTLLLSARLPLGQKRSSMGCHILWHFRRLHERTRGTPLKEPRNNMRLRVRGTLKNSTASRICVGKKRQRVD